ncbi:MAG: flagellar biosynthetic protein FliO [Treponema sp.]|nr:flagellar biosynthetic protein FliO [Treponema sp.]
MGGATLNRIYTIIILLAVTGIRFTGGMVFAQEAPAGEALGREETGGAVSGEAGLVLEEGADGGIPQGGISVFRVIQMVLALALAAAAVYGVVYFLRRAARPQDRRNPHLKILNAAHLGSNRFVYIVAVGDRAWLLGAGEGGIAPIAEIADRELIDAMLLDDSRRGAETGGFLDFRTLFRRFSGGGPSGNRDSPNRGPSVEDAAFSADNLRKNRERIRRL